MAMQTTFLRSKVARRIFVLFVGCALVPIVALTVLSFYQVSNQLKNESQKQLQQLTKAEGFAIYQRLTILDTELQVTSPQTEEGKSGQLSGNIGNHLQNARVVKNEPERLSLLGTASSTENAQSHLRSGKTLIKTGPCPGARTGVCVVMMRMIDAKHPE